MALYLCCLVFTVNLAGPRVALEERILTETLAGPGWPMAMSLGELSQLSVGMGGPDPPWVVATPEQEVPGFIRKLAEQDKC